MADEKDPLKEIAEQLQLDGTAQTGDSSLIDRAVLGAVTAKASAEAANRHQEATLEHGSEQNHVEREGQLPPAPAQYRRRRRTVLVVAPLVLGATAAAAALWSTAQRETEARDALSNAPAVQRSPERPEAAPEAAEKAAAASPLDGVEKPRADAGARRGEREQAGSQDTSKRTPSPSEAREPQPQESPDTAAALFARANAARRDQRAAEALRWYQALQEKYPSSPEAKISYLSAGRLFAARGQPAAALAQFQTYLRHGGSMQQEALLGKARALHKLGRNQEARATYRQLLEKNPQSLYAPEAREFLE